MKKDPECEKGRNVTISAVRHDEKSALRLNAILAENPLYYPSIVLRAGLLALEGLTKEERLNFIMKAAVKTETHPPVRWLRHSRRKHHDFS